jgi:Protein of unknown function (DUF1225).
VESLLEFEEQPDPVPPYLVYGDAIGVYAGAQKVSEMDRTNTFTIEDNPKLWKLADDCAKLYNEVNFERRQAYIHYKPIKWYPKQLYEKYASIDRFGDSTADHKQEQRSMEKLPSPKKARGKRKTSRTHNKSLNAQILEKVRQKRTKNSNQERLL